MTTGWQAAKELRDKLSDGRFVKLDEAGTVGTICGEPFAREVVWHNNRIVTFDKRIHSDKPRAWFAFHFYDAAAQDMKTVEGPKELFDEIVKAAAEHGLDKKTFLFQKFAGRPGKKAEYKVTAGHDIDGQLAAFIASLPLTDFGQQVAGQPTASNTPAPTPPTESPATAPTPAAPTAPPAAPTPPPAAPAAPPVPIPGTPDSETIDIELAREIAERLKALPPEKAATFLPSLGAERITAIAKASTARAFEALVELERGPGEAGVLF